MATGRNRVRPTAREPRPSRRTALKARLAYGRAGLLRWGPLRTLKNNVPRPSRTRSRFLTSRRVRNMSRTARRWKGAGPLALGGLLLSGVVARGAEPPPLSQQIAELGRQALAQGETAHARTFFQRAVQLDPNNAEARRALVRLGVVRRAELQEPAAAPGATPTTAPAFPEVASPPGPSAADTIEAAVGAPAAPPVAPVEREAQATL